VIFVVRIVIGGWVAKKLTCCFQQGGRRLRLPLLLASHVGQDVQGCFLFASFSHLLQGSAGIDDFPIWVQLIPRVIFNVICSKMRVDYITRESLRNFYENFSGLAGDNLEKVATEGYRSMSANGDYELDYKSYKLLFSNFLLGRTIYGPGKYIFGCFDNRDMNEPYKIVYDM